MAKGGGHNKGQTMPYRVVRAFAGEDVRRSAHWTIGSAQADMMMTLHAANAGRIELAEGEVTIVDVRTDEVVDKPLKCTVCDEQWATQIGHARKDAPSTCQDCEGADELDDTDQDVVAPDLPYTPPAMPDFTEADAQRAAELPAEASWRRHSGLAPIPRPVRVEDGALGEVIIGEARSGKTSAAAAAELARRLLTSRDPFAELAPKPDTIESALMNLPAGSANGVNVAQALEPAVAIFTPVNELPQADPSALLAALDRLNLPRAVWADGTVAAVANGMLWRMQAEPHAATGEPCGVWSVMSPVGVRGHFVAERAARFIRDRRTP